MEWILLAANAVVGVVFIVLIVIMTICTIDNIKKVIEGGPFPNNASKEGAVAGIVMGIITMIALLIFGVVTVWFPEAKAIWSNGKWIPFQKPWIRFLVIQQVIIFLFAALGWGFIIKDPKSSTRQDWRVAISLALVGSVCLVLSLFNYFLL